MAIGNCVVKMVVIWEKDLLNTKKLISSNKEERIISIERDDWVWAMQLGIRFRKFNHVGYRATSSSGLDYNKQIEIEWILTERFRQGIAMVYISVTLTS